MTHRRHRLTIVQALVLGAVAAIVVAMPAGAASRADAGQSHTARALDVFPTELALPDAFLPEGIAIGAQPYAYFGSRADGDIYRVNLVTGEGSTFSEGPGTPSLGMKVDPRGRLFVAGGSGGDARVIDTRTGVQLASYAFGNAPTFVNDVVVTRDAAWFTDSQQALLYKVPLGRAGSLPDPTDVVQLPLGGEYDHVPGMTNANGIAETPDGQALLIVQSATGLLFRVDPATGDATQVVLGGQALTNGDGLLLSGRTLFVVQNRLNQVAVVSLDREGTEGEIVGLLTDPRFDVPTTVAAFGNRLYLPNARFTTPPTPTTPYNAVSIPKP
jgi:sugar lactone lactonase YvrE